MNMKIWVHIGFLYLLKLMKLFILIVLINKETQCVPIFSYSSKFITCYVLILFVKLFLEYKPLNLGSFL